MVDKIYTQEDYDKITNLYNEYQDKKDSYTPEQQQRIENAFGNAWATMSNRIEDWNGRLVDMQNDNIGNTRGWYGDGSKKLLNEAPKRGARRYPHPEVDTSNLDTYWSPYNQEGNLSGARNAQYGNGFNLQEPGAPIIPDLKKKK